jgi:hypothetical protein
MANWTVKFADRTDGVIMLGDITINIKPIPADGLVVSKSFSYIQCCYTSDIEFTVNNNSFTVDTADGSATITLSDWIPNSAQMDVFKKNPNIKKYNYFFYTNISNLTGNNPIITFNPDITVGEPTPPQPVEKKYNLLDSVPAGYDVKGDYDYGSDTFEDLDVSQLKYNKGDKLPTFSLVMKDGYEYDVETWTNKWNSGDDPYLASSNLSSYYNIGSTNQQEEPPYLWITFYADNNMALPDELLTFSNIPEPTVVATHYTVQLDLLNCTADKPIVSTVNEGDSYTVNFTANDGYVFNEQPHVQIGSEIKYADVADPSHASLTITNITQNLTIIAHATEPQPVEPTEELPFVNIYNPTQAQLVDAANALFMNFDTGNVVDINPYIVSIHKVFVPVSTDEAFQPIKFGKYNTQVNSKVVNKKVSRVSCGKVTVPELYHNALDYSPFTTVRIWLPFLGFYDLSIDELSNKEIELTYTIDLVNGKALAEISNDDGVIYRFVGTAYAQEPYHTESLNNMSTAYINGAYNMADFTPYLLIKRPINLTPSNNDLEGLPTYKVVTIGDMKGYLRCRKVFATDMIATEAEKNEIEALLRDGVLVD